MELLVFVAVMLIIGMCIMEAECAKELEAANARYDYLKKQYDAVRDFCIIKDGTPPAGKYFVFGFLNVMKNLDTQACYYISSSDISKCGCDVDGDIISIIDGNMSPVYPGACKDCRAWSPRGGEKGFCMRRPHHIMANDSCEDFEKKGDELEYEI